MSMQNPRRAAGFTLIELMVSVVVGLLAILFATRIMTDSERNKDAALGGSDAMQNGMTAMFSISADAEQAGFGLNDPLLVGCNTIFFDDDGYQLAQAKRGAATVQPLAPVVIVPGGEGPDTVSLYAGTSPSGTGTMRLAANYLGGSQFSVDRNPFGFSKGDVIVVAPETAGTDCALAQISAAPTAASVQIANSSGTRYNKGALGRTFTGSATRVFNLGRADNLAFHTWSVDGGFLRLRATNMLDAAGAAQPVADNIVSLKAQYGLDTRVGTAFTPELGMQVTTWSNTMIDADSDSVAGSAGDYQRIAALRIAVVARSRNPERPPASGTCSATTGPIPLFATRQPSSVAAVPVQITPTVASDGIDWRCYRYRAFETIVPLRNSGWRP